MKRTSAVNTIILLALFTTVLLAAGCGGNSSLVPVPKTPPGHSSISSPISFSAVAGNNSVALSWSPVPGAISYNVYSSLSSPVSQTTATKHTVSGTTFVDTGLVNGVNYYYVMTSVISGMESPASLEISAIPGSTGTIRGLVTYEDKEFGAYGFTGTTSMKAVRHAAVDIVDAATSNVLRSVQTDTLGMFSVQTLANWTSVYVRVNSIAAPPSSASITIADFYVAKYGVPSQNITMGGSATVNIAISSTNSAAGAFNILDVMTTGFEFMKHLSGGYPTVPLNAFWEPGNQNGTYYCVGCATGKGIYVLSETGGDTDEYDDDVLWHEFAHYVADNYAQDDSPGGIHYLTDNALDLRLAWSEGWGDFFPGAIKTWLKATNPGMLSSAPGVALTTYVDTSNNSWSFDFGNPPYNSSYATSEVAVAKLLADLQTNYTVQTIWDVVKTYKAIPPMEPVSLELFWDRWLLDTNPSGTALAALENVFKNRSINYKDDTGEPADNLFSTTTMTYESGSPQTHTLYSASSASDKDYVVLKATNGTAYTITTSGLYNGADTYLTLYDSSGTTVVQSDDNGNGTGITYVSGVNYDYYDVYGYYTYPLNSTLNLSSKIQFTATYGGPYYVRVKSSPSRPKSAGKYGSYTLTITSP